MTSKRRGLWLMLVLVCYAGTAACAEITTDTLEEQISKVNIEESQESTSAELDAVLTLEADPEFGAYLSGECLTCHLPSGDNGAIPLIHGKDKGYLATALLQYRSKKKTNDVMQGVSALLTNDEIAALVTYLSEQ